MWLLPHPSPPNTPRVGRGSPRPASGPDTQTKSRGRPWTHGAEAGTGPEPGLVFSKEAPTPLSPRACFSFRSRSKQGQYTPLPIPSDSGGPSSPLCGLFTSCPPAAMLPLRMCRLWPLNLPCGSSQRPPGSGESGPRDRARSFIVFLLLARPILGASLGAREALCQAPYRFVGLLSPSLLKTQYQRLRNNPQGHTDPKF